MALTWAGVARVELEGAREGGYLGGSYTNLGAHPPMRATSLLKTVFGIKFTRVIGVSFTDDGLVCDVAPTTTVASACGATWTWAG